MPSSGQMQQQAAENNPAAGQRAPNAQQQPAGGNLNTVRTVPNNLHNLGAMPAQTSSADPNVVVTTHHTFAGNQPSHQTIPHMPPASQQASVPQPQQPQPQQPTPQPSNHHVAPPQQQQQQPQPQLISVPTSTTQPQIPQPQSAAPQQQQQPQPQPQPVPSVAQTQPTQPQFVPRPVDFPQQPQQVFFSRIFIRIFSDFFLKSFS